jgi:hypothetical protein
LQFNERVLASIKKYGKGLIIPDEDLKSLQLPLAAINVEAKQD